MPKKIYKYVGSEHIDKVFQSSDAATLKCSLPKDFNDPYELFLTIDFNEEPDALAYYADAIGDLPQFPTTCFSRSPVVVPMWAHYAQNQQGFVIEFSEELIVKAFPKSRLDDVEYLDAPRSDLNELLHKAYVTAKPRHTYFLQEGVFNAAYFTKASCWSYEQECRMIFQELAGRKAGSLMLIDVPNECITSIICGPRTSEEAKVALRKRAEENDCKYLELRIGKSSATPYFVDGGGESFSFDGTEVASSPQHCQACGEPLVLQAEQCAWCQIDDALRQHVASRNPFRMLDYAGLLDSYIEEMSGVGTNRKGKT